MDRLLLACALLRLFLRCLLAGPLSRFVGPSVGPSAGEGIGGGGKGVGAIKKMEIEFVFCYCDFGVIGPGFWGAISGLRRCLWASSWPFPGSPREAMHRTGVESVWRPFWVCSLATLKK